MRTKTLLLTAAVAAAGIASSMAQVFSINVVGYANVVLRGDAKYTLVANPFDNGTGNSGTNMIGYLPNKSSILTWNGTAFIGIAKSFGAWNGDFVLAPGTGFFVKNGDVGAPNVTNTFVGTVVPNSGQTTTNALAAGYKLVGNTVPFAGDTTADANINLGGLLPNKSNIIKWDSTTQGYVGVSKSFGAWSGPLTVAVGDGFFVNNGAAPSLNWVQTAP
jgi:hypothetical protein